MGLFSEQPPWVENKFVITEQVGIGVQLLKVYLEFRQLKVAKSH